MKCVCVCVCGCACVCVQVVVWMCAWVYECMCERKKEKTFFRDQKWKLELKGHNGKGEVARQPETFFFIGWKEWTV